MTTARGHIPGRPDRLDLNRRNRKPELMDQPGLDPAEHRRALDGLRRINRVSRSSRILWEPILRLSRKLGGRPLRVLDVATGGGDLPLDLWRYGRHSAALSLAGCDISDVAVAAARAAAERAGARIEFFRHDVLEAPLPDGYDVITASLFLHHLDESDAVRLLRSMAAAGRLVLVNDLERTWVGYLAAYLGSRALTRSPVVHVDAPLSVEAAFSVAEARRLALRAGLRGARVVRRFPFRFLLSWAK